MHGGSVAIPVQLDYRDFSRDPASGVLKPNCEKGYAIDVKSLVDHPLPETASQWDEVTKPRPVAAAVRKVEHESSSMPRWSIAMFFLFVVALIVLFRLRTVRAAQG
jgi:hypothetical protein